MQQTEKYKLNLIETSDTFSPNPLNENTQKLEAALAEANTQLSAETADLDSRVTVLEARKIVAGYYTGDFQHQRKTINLGFTPAAVLVQNSGGMLYMATTDVPYNTDDIVIKEGGFSVSYLFNGKADYPFLAIK